MHYLITPISYLALLILLPYQAQAGQITASALQTHCQEVKNAARGSTYDKESAEFCRGYMSAFFDSMIITEQLSNRKHLCIPRSVPTNNNYSILERWIEDNQQLAPTATAAVALYSAFKTAYPCDKD
jgi:hypothetical protein